MDPRDDSSTHNRNPPSSSPPPQPGLPFGPFRYGLHWTDRNSAFRPYVPNSANPSSISNPNISLVPSPHPFDPALVDHRIQPPQHHQQQLQPQTQPHPQQQRNVSPASGVITTATLTVRSEQTTNIRRRPREQSPAPEDITLGLATNPLPVSNSGVENGVRNGNGVEGSRRKRGRPMGSRNNQSDATRAVGSGAAYHVVTVPEGENIASRLVELSQGPRTIYVAGAWGSVRNVTLRHITQGTSYHEGRFDIVTLSGSSCFPNRGGSQNNTLNLTVTLAGPGGRIFGGGVTSELIAASSIQLLLGSFIAENTQSNRSSSPLPTPPSQRLSLDGSGSAPRSNPTQRSDSQSDEVSSHPQNRTSAFYNYGQSRRGG